MNSKVQERIKAQFMAVIGSIAESSPDLLVDLEKLRDMGALDNKNASTILQEAVRVNSFAAIYYLLKAIDGEFELDGAFECYFKIDHTQEHYKDLYRLALKTCDAKYVSILHDKLGYSKKLDETSLKICVQVAQQNFENFLSLISAGENLSGQECSWGFRAQEKMDIESWKKLQKFHEVLACHPAVLANKTIYEKLKRDIELAKNSIRNLTKDKVKQEMFSSKPDLEEDSDLRRVSSTSLSGQDPASSLSNEIEGCNFIITEELLRSRMDHLGNSVDKGYYSGKQRL